VRARLTKAAPEGAMGFGLALADVTFGPKVRLARTVASH
jgi:hypothetical protein